MSHCSSTICCKGCPSCIELLLHFIKKNQLDIFVWACLWVLYSIPLIYTFIPLKYHTILIIVKVKMLVAQSCLSLCDPMNCSLSGSSVYGIFQARVLEWGAISLSRGSSQPRDRTWVSCTAGRLLTGWAMREVFCRLLHFARIQIRVFWGPEVERRSPGQIYNSVWYKKLFRCHHGNEITEAHWVASQRSVEIRSSAIWVHCDSTALTFQYP